jgi:hypothetical protein
MRPGSSSQRPPGPLECAADAARAPVCGQPCGHAQGRAVPPVGQKLPGSHRHDPGRSRLQPEAAGDIGRQHNRIMQHLHKHGENSSRSLCAMRGLRAGSCRIRRSHQAAGHPHAGNGPRCCPRGACVVRVRRTPARRSVWSRSGQGWNTADPHGGPSTGPAPAAARRLARAPRGQPSVIRPPVYFHDHRGRASAHRRLRATNGKSAAARASLSPVPSWPSCADAR